MRRRGERKDLGEGRTIFGLDKTYEDFFGIMR